MVRLITLLISILITNNVHADIWHVDAAAAGNNDGTSWINAFNKLQDAIAASNAGDKIYVAKGTYYPDEGSAQTDNLRSSTFAILSGVEMFGAFPSGGGILEQRDTALNETILSGDLDQNDGPEFTNRESNTHHVLTADGSDSLSLIDGFSIEGGYAFGDFRLNEEIGGAILITNNASPIINNCTFRDNTAESSGGAIFIKASSPTITNSSFSKNECRAGAAISNGSGSSLSISNCLFNNNTTGPDSGAGAGGAILNNGADDNGASCLIHSSTFQKNTATIGGAIGNFNNSSCTISESHFLENSATSFSQSSGGAISGDNLTITNTSFLGNTAVSLGNSTSFGGAISGGDDCTFINCTFQGNHTGERGFGGAMTISRFARTTARTTLINCSFQGNSSGIFGGAMASFTRRSPNLINCIIWNNVTRGVKNTASASVYHGDDPSPTYSHCLIENIIPAGPTNLDGTNPLNNPRFVLEVDPFQAPSTTGNLQLLAGSPALDVGNNNENSNPTDLAGNPRVQNSIIDLGAYEGAVNDLSALFATDFDLDGTSYGVEVALGTDPESADGTSPKNLSIPNMSNDGSTANLSFAKNPSFPENTTLFLMRSKNLTSFSRIATINSSTAFPSEADDMISDNFTSFLFQDNNPPSTNAFYRLEAEYTSSQNSIGQTCFFNK